MSTHRGKESLNMYVCITGTWKCLKRELYLTICNCFRPDWWLSQNFVMFRCNFLRGEVYQFILCVYRILLHIWNYSEFQYALIQNFHRLKSIHDLKTVLLSFFNHVHNSLILFDGWANFPFTTSEMKRNY